jgi:hypothetical protein
MLSTPSSSQITMNVSSTSGGSSYNPNSFGPALWFTLHNASTTYPDFPDLRTKQAMKQLLLNLPLLIPCGICKQHWIQNLNTFDLNVVVNSRDNLFTFLVHAHNLVNKLSQKPQMTVDEAKILYGFNRPGTGSTIRINYY